MKKCKCKPVVTADGVPIKINDIYWYFRTNGKVYSIKVKSAHDLLKGVAQFSTKDLARSMSKVYKEWVKK